MDAAIAQKRSLRTTGPETDLSQAQAEASTFKKSGFLTSFGITDFLFNFKPKPTGQAARIKATLERHVKLNLKQGGSGPPLTDIISKKWVGAYNASQADEIA